MDRPSTVVQMMHLDKNQLANYMNHQLDAEQRTAVDGHLAECEACRTELEAVRLQLINTADALVTPPTTLIDQLKMAFKRKRAQLADVPKRRADLAFDSWSNLAVLGVRGTPAEHQMLFNDGEYDLDVQVVKENANDYVVRGQLLSAESDDTDLTGIELRFVDESDQERRSLTDHLGRFTFAHCLSGTYTLHVMLEDRIIVLDDLVIQQ